MRRTLCLTLTMVALLAASGCAEPTESEAKEAKSVEVRVIKRDKDRSYELAPSGTLVNEEYSGGKVTGHLVVSARSTNPKPDTNETPYLAALVKSKSGKPDVRCEMSRSYVWSDFENFMDLDLQCATKVVASDVDRVVVINQV